MKKCRPLMCISGLKHTIRIIRPKHTLQSFGKTRLFDQGIDINGMKIITAVQTPLYLIGLILVGFRREIPCVRGPRRSFINLTKQRGLMVLKRYCTYGSITPVPVIPIVGLMSTQPSRSAVKNGTCRFLDATTDPVLALIL